MEWHEVAGLIGAGGLAHLATADATGRPFVAVVSAVVEGDHLWIFTTRGSRKARNLAVNPRLSLMWRPQAEVYLQADADLVDEPAETARLWHSGLLPFDPAGFFGTPANPDLVLVRVRPRTATVLDAGPDGPRRRHWSA